MGRPAENGHSLVELMIGISLGVILLLGVSLIFSAFHRSFLAQQADLQITRQGQAAIDFLDQTMRQSGSRTQPWNQPPLAAIGDASANSNNGSDSIELILQSDYNCFGNLNPLTGPDGLALSGIKTHRFGRPAGSERLAWFCSYEVAGHGTVVQVNNQTLVDGVDAFEIRYAEDLDGDGSPNRWVSAGDWANPADVIQLEYALLINAGYSPVPGAASSYTVLGQLIGSFTDDWARQVFGSKVAIRNRPG